MDDSLANAFVDPQSVVRQIAVKPGAVVADFGCGSGFFSIAFAQAVGSDGRVYCLDILPSALEAVTSRCKTLGVANVVAKRANVERLHGSDLPDQSVDWVILKDILFQNKDKKMMLREAHRVMKPGSSMFVMEWGEADSPVGPDTHLRLPKEKLKALVEESGFRVVRDIEVGHYHYAFLLKKEDE